MGFCSPFSQSVSKHLLSVEHKCSRHRDRPPSRSTNKVSSVSSRSSQSNGVDRLSIYLSSIYLLITFQGIYNIREILNKKSGYSSKSWLTSVLTETSSRLFIRSQCPEMMCSLIRYVYVIYSIYIYIYITYNFRKIMDIKTM